jgi:hypothetical protein
MEPPPATQDQHQPDHPGSAVPPQPPQVADAGAAALELGVVPDD